MKSQTLRVEIPYCSCRLDGELRFISTTISLGLCGRCIPAIILLKVAVLSYIFLDGAGKAIYREIVEPKKEDYIDYFPDADGNNNESLPATATSALATLEFSSEGMNLFRCGKDTFSSSELP